MTTSPNNQTEKPFYEHVIENIIDRRDRIVTGKLNCIPFDLPGYNYELPGIEQSQYIIVTANQKVGKTQLCDWLYLYTPIEYVMRHIDDPEFDIDVKIYYFSLEMSKQKKIMQLMCYLIFSITGQKFRISIKGLNSVFENKIIDQEIIDLIQSPVFKKLLQFYDDHVVIIDNIRNPFGIFKKMKEVALSNGYFEKTVMDWEDPETKKITKREVNGRYIKNNPNLYIISIIDHYSLLQPDKGQLNVRDAMIKFSSEYALELRDKFSQTVVGVQQQAQSQESVENKKIDKLLPSVDGLGEAKITARDVDLLIGLFSPYRHDYTTYSGYDVHQFKNNLRILTVPANREGAGTSQVPLIFDGATNYFSVLPNPKNLAQMRIYENILRRVQNNDYIEDDKGVSMDTMLFHQIKTTKLKKLKKLIKNTIKKWQKF